MVLSSLLLTLLRVSRRPVHSSGNESYMNRRRLITVVMCECCDCRCRCPCHEKYPVSHQGGYFCPVDNQKKGSAGPTAQICRLLDGWPCCITKHRSELLPELMKQCHGGDISFEGTEVRHRGKRLQHPCWFKRCSLSQAGFGWFVISQLVLIPAETIPGNRIHQECSKKVQKKKKQLHHSFSGKRAWEFLSQCLISFWTVSQ